MRRPAEGLCGDVGERAVAAVAIQLTPAEHAGHEQVEETVLVVVEDGDVTGPAAASETGVVGLVGEGSVAIVVVQNVGFRGTGLEVLEVGLALEVAGGGVEDVGGPLCGVGEKQVKVAVVVVIKEYRGLRVSDVAQPGGRGDVLESAVPPVVPQHVASPGSGHEEVGPTVVVVIGERGRDGDPVADYDNDG